MTASAGELHGKAALVTGGSRGIGRAIALGLAAKGASVVVGYRERSQAADETVTSIVGGGGRAAAIQADLSSVAEARRLYERATEAVGALDIVVANAADALVKPFMECSEDDFDRIFNTNARGVFFTMQEAARRLPDGGRIIVTSTGGTRMFFTETSLYLGSKAAVEQFVRVLSRELGERRITVNAVSPGFTDTDLLPERDRAVAADMSPFGRVGDPADVAEVAVFLATDAARWITGQNVAAGGGVF